MNFIEYVKYGFQNFPFKMVAGSILVATGVFICLAILFGIFKMIGF